MYLRKEINSPHTICNEDKGKVSELKTTCAGRIVSHRWCGGKSAIESIPMRAGDAIHLLALMTVAGDGECNRRRGSIHYILCLLAASRL